MRHCHVLVAVVVFLFAAAGFAPGVALADDQSTLSLTASKTTLAYGEQAKLTARGSSAGTQLTLSRKRAADADFIVVGTKTADDAGAASWTIGPCRSTTYRVEAVDGGEDPETAEVCVGVRPKITLEATARRPLLENKRVRYTVRVRPLHAGGTVLLRRRTADGWVTMRELTLGDDSRAKAAIVAGKPGRLVVRAEMAADADNLSGYSSRWRRTVYDRRNPYGVPTKYAHLILVDLSKFKLYYHEHGIVIRVFKCVLGRPSLPTPKGHFKIYAKDAHVGGAYGPYRMRYLGLYAIHGTNEPWLLRRFPRKYSHGCTRLSNTNITWLYKRVPVGTRVWNVR